LGHSLKGPVGGDRGGASVVVALADDLEGELGLGGVHLEASEVIDGEQVGLGELAQHTLEAAVDLQRREAR
jgi:hypothetical protein